MGFLRKLFSSAAAKPQRLSIRGHAVAGLLAQHFGDRIKRKLIISAPNYQTLTRDELFKIAGRRFLPWQNGNCERQSFTVLTEAAFWDQEQKHAELSAVGVLWGHVPHIAELHSFTFGVGIGRKPGTTFDLFLLDQTSGLMHQPDELIGDVFPVIV